MQLEVLISVKGRDNCHKFEASLCYKVMRLFLRPNRNYRAVNGDMQIHLNMELVAGNPRV